MRVLVLMASERGDSGETRLLSGDRAAACLGIRLAASDCRIQTPEGDRAARAYASAIGAANEPWDEHSGEQPELVLIGPGAIHRFGDELAGKLADRISAHLSFDALEVHRDGTNWRVVCDAGRGAKEVARLSGPQVVVFSSSAPRPPYVSRFRLQPGENANTAIDAPSPAGTRWEPAVPRAPRSTRTTEVDVASRANAAFGIDAGSTSPRYAEIVRGAPAQCAQILLRYLVHHRFLSRLLPPDASSPATAPVSGHSDPVGETILPRRVHNVLIGSIQRGPRRSSAAIERMLRRPRRAATKNDDRDPSLRVRLSRKPRRLGGGEKRPERGPYPLNPGKPHGMSAANAPIPFQTQHKPRSTD